MLRERADAGNEHARPRIRTGGNSVQGGPDLGYNRTMGGEAAMSTISRSKTASRRCCRCCIALACDLLAQDLGTPATTAVAGLPWGATLGDSGPVIRDMVREQGFAAPGPGAGSAEEFAFVLRAVAAVGLPVSDFYAYFMRRVPAWEQQDEMQRRLVVLLNDWDGETTPEGMAAAAAIVREFAGEAARR